MLYRPNNDEAKGDESTRTLGKEGTGVEVYVMIVLVSSGNETKDGGVRGEEHKLGEDVPVPGVHASGEKFPTRRAFSARSSSGTRRLVPQPMHRPATGVWCT